MSSTAPGSSGKSGSAGAGTGSVEEPSALRTSSLRPVRSVKYLTCPCGFVHSRPSMAKRIFARWPSFTVSRMEAESFLKVKAMWLGHFDSVPTSSVITMSRLVNPLAKVCVGRIFSTTPVYSYIAAIVYAP